MRRTTRREIWASFGRYMAIMAIIALGVGLFAGLKVTKATMVGIADAYVTEHQLYDYRLISTLGLEKEDAEAFAAADGIRAAEGAVFADVIYHVGENETEYVASMHSLTQKINTLELRAGRMPQAPNECVADDRAFSEDAIGQKLHISGDNKEDTLEMLVYDEYEIVGLVSSPAYLNFERGNTSVGSGSIACFVYAPTEGFSFDYYSEIYVKLDSDFVIHSDAYQDEVDAHEDAVRTLLEAAGERRYDTIVSDAKKEIADAQEELDEESAKAKAELDEAYDELIRGEEELESAEKQLAQQKEELEDAASQLEQGIAQIADGEAQLEAAAAALEGLKELDASAAQNYAALQANLAGLRAQRSALEQQLAQVRDGLAQIEDGFAEIDEAKADLEEGWAEYRDGLAQYEEQTAEGQQEIDDALAELEGLEKPSVYVLTRNENVGYVCFENDSGIVEGMANVFPVFFFLVAALVCVTTMNRMVEEQRTQIGVLKALGYSKTAIMSKYMIYSGSAAMIGCVSGFLIGSYVFPNVIWAVYQIMYSVGGSGYIIDVPLACISVAVSLLCSIGTTWLSCRMELSSNAAQLIRPKTPKAGKRIFLEKMPFIWKRMKFLHKVSARNIFRYKKRFFMMVIGISGCTALILTGLGIKDSIADVVTEQYDNIQSYDISVTFRNAPTDAQREELASDTQGMLESTVYCMQKTVDISFGHMTKSISLIVPESTDGITEVLHLFDSDGTTIPYPGPGEAVISVKYAERLGIRIGDSVTLRDSDMREFTVKITGIFTNYVHNYLYLCAESCRDLFGEDPEYKYLWCNIAQGQDVYAVGAKIMNHGNTASVSITEDVKERFGSMMSSLNYIVVLVTFCAAALAFIVLYNLTNINITERIREIATIKVLGFYPGETAAYVFRENMVLTAMGAVVGIPLGIWLHRFVMDKIDMDIVNFHVQILPRSYAFGIVMTFAFAILVNGVMYFKLQKINMAESLKSIE